MTHSAGGGEADAALPPGDVQANRGEARAYAHGSGAVQTVAAREVYSHRDRDVLTSAGGARTCFDSPHSQSEKARSGYLDGSTPNQHPIPGELHRFTLIVGSRSKRCLVKG